MLQPAPESLSPFQLGYLAGLFLSPRKTPHAMREEGLLPFSPSRASALLSLRTRLVQEAPRPPGEAVGRGVGGREKFWMDKGVVYATSFAGTLAVKDNGTVWVWGRNEFGQLGVGNREHQGVPVQIKLPDMP